MVCNSQISPCGAVKPGQHSEICELTEIFRGRIVDVAPHEVTVEQWFHIIKTMQQITIDKKGNVVSVGDFSENDEDEKSDWVQWNKSLDERRLENLKRRLNMK